MRVIIDSMARLPLNYFSQADLYLLKRRLTIIPKATTFEPNPDPIVLYKQDMQSIAIPREYYFKMTQGLNDELYKVSEGQPMRELEPIKLKREQRPVVAQVMLHFKKGGLGGILNAETAFGKTVCSIEMARRLGRATVIKIYKDSLANQWVERIKTFFPEAKIGRIQGDKLDYEGKDFVIAMIQTLASRRDHLYRKEGFRDHFGLEITDEVHRFGSREWGSVADLFNCKYRLGLSATVRRKDNCEDVFKYHLGDIVAVGKGIALVPDIYFIETGFTVTDNFNINTMPVFVQLKMLFKNSRRNKIIVENIVKCLAAGRKPIVLSKYTKHLQDLHVLTQIALNYEANKDKKHLFDKTLGLYVGALYTGDSKKNKKGEKVEIKIDQSKEDLEKAAKSDCIFATYKMAEDALDIPELDTLFMAMPISDPEQSAGRILRVKDGKKKPLIVDICDENVNFCSALKRKRIKMYQSKNWRLTVLKKD